VSRVGGRRFDGAQRRRPRSPPACGPDESRLRSSSGSFTTCVVCRTKVIRPPEIVVDDMAHVRSDKVPSSVSTSVWA
jgi:hypothetical protein